MTTQPFQIIECEQGSPEWYTARLGIPTASEFKTIIGVKKDAREKLTRRTYMRKLAGEVLTGKAMDTYSNPIMDRGTELEDEARMEYSFAHDVEPQRVGFIRRGYAGCSPDSLIGAKGGLEIKCVLPHTQIERLEAGVLPPEYRPQVQGSMLISGRDWWDFVSYCPGLPLFVCRVASDPLYIQMLSDGIDAFNAELADMVAFVRNYSGRKAAA